MPPQGQPVSAVAQPHSLADHDRVREAIGGNLGQAAAVFRRLPLNGEGVEVAQVVGQPPLRAKAERERGDVSGVQARIAGASQ